MKAFLLAAGMGTRLKPLTDTIPKCLIPINGKPLLEIWFELLKKHHITEVLVNTHHHSAVVERFIEQKASEMSMNIVSVYEEKLLGSGGTVFANRGFAAGCENFVIAYADNLTDINLSKMIGFHEKCLAKGGVLTMGLIRADDPKSCGIVTLDQEDKIISFVEKPDHPETNLANSGIYVASEGIFDIILKIKSTTEPDVLDFGFHVLPLLSKKMFGYKVKEYLKDIGSLESYTKAQVEWSEKRWTK